MYNTRKIILNCRAKIVINEEIVVISGLFWLSSNQGDLYDWDGADKINQDRKIKNITDESYRNFATE